MKEKEMVQTSLGKSSELLAKVHASESAEEMCLEIQSNC